MIIILVNDGCWLVIKGYLKGIFDLFEGNL